MRGHHLDQVLMPFSSRAAGKRREVRVNASLKLLGKPAGAAGTVALCRGWVG